MYGRTTGTVHSIVEKCIVVRGDDIASSDLALDVESVLCDENRKVLGMIVETFGQVVIMADKGYRILERFCYISM